MGVKGPNIINIAALEFYYLGSWTLRNKVVTCPLAELLRVALLCVTGLSQGNHGGALKAKAQARYLFLGCC